RVKLRHLNKWTEKRRSIAKLYNQLLDDTAVKTPSENTYSKHVYHQYVVRVPKRDNVIDILTEQRIGSGIHYPIPLHLQPALSYLGYQVGDLPHAELAAKEVMSLPIYPEMTESQVTIVSNVLHQALIP
ncbi:MAG: DegT/DnrJ/EryC1/StrS family aminotransferase, partial [Anaerolineales bacterium]|nr:DegT/DnrJ/EryC1/StrS family aminotransferase [Anaerolineales bacterium]